MKCHSSLREEKLANPIIKFFPAKPASSASSSAVVQLESKDEEELPAIDYTTDPPSHTLTMKMGTASKVFFFYLQFFNLIRLTPIKSPDYELHPRRWTTL